MFLWARQAIQSMRGHLAASPHHLTERRRLSFLRMLDKSRAAA
jgi:hypothetical protein